MLLLIAAFAVSWPALVARSTEAAAASRNSMLEFGRAASRKISIAADLATAGLAGAIKTIVRADIGFKARPTVSPPLVPSKPAPRTACKLKI